MLSSAFKRFCRGAHAKCFNRFFCILPSLDCALHARTVGPELLSQCFEKGDARTDRQGGIAGQDFARQRHPRRFAAARKQVFAQHNKIRRAGYRIGSALARQIEKLPPAVGNGLQHIAEKGAIHRNVRVPRLAAAIFRRALTLLTKMRRFGTDLQVVLTSPISYSLKLG